MAFRFPLQSVLRLRQSLEHQQELRLHTANLQVGRVKRQIDQLDRSIRDTQQESSRQLASGTRAAAIRFALEVDSILRGRRRELELELLRVTLHRDQQQQVFQQARRDRETFEILREHKLREYRREQGRREQKSLDELFLSQQAFRRRGYKLPD